MRFVAALMLIALALPVATAGFVSESKFAFQAPNQLEFRFNQTFMGELARDWRKAVDADGDGNVTAAEANATSTSTDPRPASSRVTFAIRVDGKGPNKQDTYALTREGVEGPTNRTDALTYRIHALAHYAIEPKTVHEVTIDSSVPTSVSGASNDTSGRATLRIEPAPEYEFLDVQSAGDRAAITHQYVEWAFDAGNDTRMAPEGQVKISMRTHEEDGGKSPDLGVALVLAGLAGAAAIVWPGRRRG